MCTASLLRVYAQRALLVRQHDPQVPCRQHAGRLFVSCKCFIIPLRGALIHVKETAYEVHGAEPLRSQQSLSWTTNVLSAQQCTSKDLIDTGASWNQNKPTHIFPVYLRLFSNYHPIYAQVFQVFSSDFPNESMCFFTYH